MIKYTLLFIALFVIKIGAMERKEPLDTINVKINTNGDSIFVSNSIKSNKISLASHYHGRKIDKIEECYTCNDSRNYHILLITSWSSNSGGYCGAGAEIDMIYIKLKMDLESEEIQSELISSCLKNIEPICRKIWDVTNDAIYSCHWTIINGVVKNECDIFYKNVCPVRGIIKLKGQECPNKAINH